MRCDHIGDPSGPGRYVQSRRGQRRWAYRSHLIRLLRMNSLSQRQLERALAQVSDALDAKRPLTHSWLAPNNGSAFASASRSKFETVTPSSLIPLVAGNTVRTSATLACRN